MLIAAFDPGRNLGFALVDDRGRLIRSAVVDGLASTGSLLIALDVPAGATVVVGGGTGGAELVDRLRTDGADPVTVDEAGTSLEARALYFRDHNPRLPWRLLPRGLWTPPRPIDDYAAYAIALRYLRALAAKEGRAGDRRH